MASVVTPAHPPPMEHAPQQEEEQEEEEADTLFSSTHEKSVVVRRTNGGGARKWVLGAAICVALGVGIVVGILLASNKSSSGAASVGGAPSNPNGPEQGGSFDVPTPAPVQGSMAPTTELEAIFRSHSPTGGTEFNDRSSYQVKALEWVESHPLVNTMQDASGISDLDRQLQRFSLACILQATNQTSNPWIEFEFGDTWPGLPWNLDDGWLVDDDECTWRGLTCDAQGRVTEMDLKSNSLSGVFPPEAGYLTSLRVLDLSNNLFYNRDNAGNDWLGELTALERLYTANSNFQFAGIPPAIGKLTNLQEYDCSYSLYYGPLDPAIFKNLVDLEYLYISGNSFDSPLPTTLAQLPVLKYLYAEYTDITGDLEWLYDMPALIEAWVDRNPDLGGRIDSRIGQVSTLASFSLTRSGLKGRLPTELGQLTMMQQMWLYDNELTGPIPTELANLSLLKYLEVEANRLSGDMPAGICSRHAPFGDLVRLDADCEVTCDCCDCCGPACVDNSNDTNDNSIGGGGERRLNRRRALA